MKNTLHTRAVFIGAMPLLMAISACSLLNPTVRPDNEYIQLDTLDIPFAEHKMMPLHPSTEILADLVHTELELKFDWENEHVDGRAEVTLSPRFYALDTLSLDAKGFSFESIDLLANDSLVPLDYLYDQRVVSVILPELFDRDDTLTLVIKYTARPGTIEKQAGQAITSNQGLYFVNADGSDTTFSKQIWSQGETTFNSAWFPTIDHPNQKMTQGVLLTVDTALETLSNGRLMYSTINSDGTRSDYWKQALPHAPYLTMIGVGDFAVVKDEWRGIPVWYYVDPPYRDDARAIFGNTPEMLEYYSELLGVDYPWEKYHQMIAHDYVSGAMENTSAVIHGEFVQQTRRELIDSDHEDVIAHELFHHWFGDLVTCESWAQLTLNEGFATYGEYLWKTHKYGEDAADYHLARDLSAYLSEAAQKQVPLIRFRYEQADDMFDAHSYQKGGRVLHMLRHEVGDEAFFAALKHYLSIHAFSVVEIEHLRQSFEAVTGQDLRWFFDQWYMAPGHPVVTAVVNPTDYGLQLAFQQHQSPAMYPTFALEVPVHILTSQGWTQRQLAVRNVRDTFRIEVADSVLTVSIDPKGVLLWDMGTIKPQSYWRQEFLRSNFYVARSGAFEELIEQEIVGDQEVLGHGLDDPFWVIRKNTADEIKPEMVSSGGSLEQRLKTLAAEDPKPQVRAAAIRALNRCLPKDQSGGLFKAALQDSSYTVINAALGTLAERNPDGVSTLLKPFEAETEGGIPNSVAALYALYGGPEHTEYFNRIAPKIAGYAKIQFMADYTHFAIRVSEEEAYNDVTKYLVKTVRSDQPWWIRLMAIREFGNLKKAVDQELELLDASGEALESVGERQALMRNRAASLSALLDELKEEETDERLMSMYDHLVK